MARTEVRGGQILDASVSLTADVTGTLPAGNGGTGVASPTANGVLIANGSSAMTTVAPGTSGNVLTSNGSVWASTAQAGGGDVTQTGTQTLTNKTIDGPSNTITNVTGLLQPVRVVAEGSGLTFTIASGTVTQITGTTIDGLTMAVGDRILIGGAPASTGTGTAQSNQPGNGIYVVTNATTNTTVSRATDFSTGVVPWSYQVRVREGAWASYIMGFTAGTGAFTWGTTALQYTDWFNPVLSIAYAASTQTFTNKRINPRVVSPSVAGTYTVDWTNCDQYVIGTQNAAITNLTATGTAVDGQKILFRIKGDATPRAITWDSAKYVSSGVATLLATTAASKTHFVGVVYDGVLGKMVCVAVDATGY